MTLKHTNMQSKQSSRQTDSLCSLGVIVYEVCGLQQGLGLLLVLCQVPGGWGDVRSATRLMQSRISQVGLVWRVIHRYVEVVVLFAFFSRPTPIGGP